MLFILSVCNSFFMVTKSQKCTWLYIIFKVQFIRLGIKCKEQTSGKNVCSFIVHIQFRSYWKVLKKCIHVKKYIHFTLIFHVCSVWQWAWGFHFNGILAATCVWSIKLCTTLLVGKSPNSQQHVSGRNSGREKSHIKNHWDRCKEAIIPWHTKTHSCSMYMTVHISTDGAQNLYITDNYL